MKRYESVNADHEVSVVSSDFYGRRIGSRRYMVDAGLAWLRDGIRSFRANVNSNDENLDSFLYGKSSIVESDLLNPEVWRIHGWNTASDTPTETGDYLVAVKDQFYCLVVREIAVWDGMRWLDIYNNDFPDTESVVAWRGLPGLPEVFCS